MWTWLKRLAASATSPTASSPKQLVLKLGGEAIAEIVVDSIDFPWTYGHLIDPEKFERFRPYFTDASTWADDDPNLDSLCSEVRAKGGFRLHCLTTGAVFTDVLLHQEDCSVWFRYRPEAGT